MIFLLLFVILLVSHAGLLRLPYFWDETGYYVPAARDLWLTGSLVPHSTPSNAHPPLVMAYLAGWWKIAGYSPFTTRTAMLGIAAFALLGIFRLARRVANLEVAIASTICTALYPVFFAQSSLAQVDLAVAGLTFWGLLAYVDARCVKMAIWFSLAVLAKETAILGPLALVGWELLRIVLKGKYPLIAFSSMNIRMNMRKYAFLLFPLLPLGAWYAYHYHKTGFIFGNAEFFRYNVQATVQPLRIFLAFLMRTWQTVGYMNLYLLTLAALFAMWRPAIHDEQRERPRIAFDVQFAFLAVALTYMLAMAIVGGAVLARYMLPVVPLVIIVCVSTLWRRVVRWRAVVAIVVVGFVVGLFVNPPYSFSLEDNLAYRDFIQLHEHGETFLQAHYPNARVLTAWPANDELTRPHFGYVKQPMQVVRIEDFTIDELMSAAEQHSRFDVAFVFSTKYQPPYGLLDNWRAWEKIKIRFFGYHRDVTPLLAARILGGRLVYTESRNGQWVGVIELQPVVEAWNHP